MTKAKIKPKTASDAVKSALAQERRLKSDLKPIEIVKIAISAYQTYYCASDERDEPILESKDRSGLLRGTQSSIDRLLFNVNYWLSAYEDRIVDACNNNDNARELLRSIATWNSHTMKLNTLTSHETVELFERFNPPFAENRRRGTGKSGSGKGPVHDFVQRARSIIDEGAPSECATLAQVVADIEEEAASYDAYNSMTPLDAFYDLLPAWCLQDRIALVRATWWNDADVMTLIAERVYDRFLDLGYAEALCDYYLDAMRESIDAYANTVDSEESPYRSTPVPQLIELVRATRAAHPDAEIEGYGDELPSWLSNLEQLIWNTIVCAIYGPMHARPLLADNLSLLPIEGKPAQMDVITDLAQRAYLRYLAIREDSGINPEFQSFDSQPESLRNSGLERIESIPEMFSVLGYRIVPLASCYPNQHITSLKPSEVECLAILEHRRWTKERMSTGWKFAPVKDVKARQSPYLVDWDDLPDRAKEWNRKTARDIPTLLESVGLAISE